MGDFEAASLGVVELSLKYHPSIIRYLTPKREQCVVGSLTGVVASKKVTEASKGALSTVGNRT